MCVYLFFPDKSYLCGLIRDCAFIYFSCKKKSRKKMICFHIHSNRPALIINSGKENDLFWWNFNHMYLSASCGFKYFTFNNNRPYALIWAFAFIYYSKFFRPVHLFRSVRLLGSPKYMLLSYRPRKRKTEMNNFC